MKMNFTKKDYLSLLEILQIADWVLHAQRTDEPEDRKKYREFEQRIFSLAKDYGCDHLVQFDPKPVAIGPPANTTTPTRSWRSSRNTMTTASGTN